MGKDQLYDAEWVVRELHKAYVAAKKTTYKYRDQEKIFRGHNHIISSVAEDAFAFYLANNLSDEFEIYVDWALVGSKKDRQQNTRPDVIVLKRIEQFASVWRNDNCAVEQEIIALFNVKTDIGYSGRDVKALYDNNVSALKYLRPNVAGSICRSENHIDGSSNPYRYYRISPNVTYSTVVFSSYGMKRSLSERLLSQLQNMAVLESECASNQLPAYIFFPWRGRSLNDFTPTRDLARPFIKPKLEEDFESIVSLAKGERILLPDLMESEQAYVNATQGGQAAKLARTTADEGNIA